MHINNKSHNKEVLDKFEFKYFTAVFLCFYFIFNALQKHNIIVFSEVQTHFFRLDNMFCALVMNVIRPFRVFGCTLYI